MIISRYPYTYAADYLRISINEDMGLHLSRAEAARIRHRIAEAIEIDDEEVAMKMADVYLLDGLLQNSKLPCV